MPEIIPNWHPILVHFTFALLFLSPFFFAAGLLGKKQPWGHSFTVTGRAFLWTGVLITGITVWAGFGAMEQAHEYISEQTHHHIHDHRNWAIATAISFTVLGLWSFVNWHRGLKESWLLVALLFTAAGSLAMTGYKGGELVYQHGVGVLPQLDSGSHGGHEPNSEPSNHDHNHNH